MASTQKGTQAQQQKPNTHMAPATSIANGPTTLSEARTGARCTSTLRVVGSQSQPHLRLFRLFRLFRASRQKHQTHRCWWSRCSCIVGSKRGRRWATGCVAPASARSPLPSVAAAAATAPAAAVVSAAGAGAAVRAPLQTRRSGKTENVAICSA